MHNNVYKLFLNFETGLYTSALVMKLFNNRFKPKLLL